MESIVSFGRIAGIAGISVGVLLVLFRDFIRKQIFSNLGPKHSFQILVIFLVLVWSVALAGIAAWVWGDRLTDSRDSTELIEPFDSGLVINGSFEDRLRDWGTGYYENRRNYPVFWASWVDINGESQPVDVRGDLDSEIARTGQYSFRITSEIEPGPHRYGTMSQRVTGLDPHAVYEIRFWAKTMGATRATLRLVTNLEWNDGFGIPHGTYEWTEFIYEFNTEERNEIDLRFINDTSGIVWIDDVSMRRVVNN